MLVTIFLDDHRNDEYRSEVYLSWTFASTAPWFYPPRQSMAFHGHFGPSSFLDITGAARPQNCWVPVTGIELKAKYVAQVGWLYVVGGQDRDDRSECARLGCEPRSSEVSSFGTRTLWSTVCRRRTRPPRNGSRHICGNPALLAQNSPWTADFALYFAVTAPKPAGAGPK